MRFSPCKTTGRALNRLFLRAVKAQLRIAIVTMLTGGLTACRTTDIAATDLSCDVFSPIIWSKQDSVQTAKQIREHNAAWVSLCVKDD